MEIIEKKGFIVVKDLKNFDLEETFECGQCFRWKRTESDEYIGVVENKVVKIFKENDEFIFEGCTYDEFTNFWIDYLDLNTDYGVIIDRLVKKDDVMKRACSFAEGIRILKQPLFETLISFIISANNSIPNIKRVIERLSIAYGKEIIFDNKKYFSFPTVEKLASANEFEIRKMKAGFRSPYIIKTSKLFLEEEFTVEKLKLMGYRDAKNFIMKCAGVGSKVADCTLLFSGAFTNAFPVDVWIKRIIQTYYLDKDKSLKEISEFADNKFKDLAGYAQQYLFYYARSNM